MLIAILEFPFLLTDGRGRAAGFFFTSNTISYQIIFLVGQAMALYKSVFFKYSLFSSNPVCKPVASFCFLLKMLNIFVNFYKFLALQFYEFYYMYKFTCVNVIAATTVRI